MPDARGRPFRATQEVRAIARDEAKKVVPAPEAGPALEDVVAAVLEEMAVELDTAGQVPAVAKVFRTGAARLRAYPRPRKGQ